MSRLGAPAPMASALSSVDGSVSAVPELLVQEAPLTKTLINAQASYNGGLSPTDYEAAHAA